MNVGDKVREKHGSYEGVIKSINKAGLCEVEIEDGFVIPLYSKSLVVVHAAEKTYFQQDDTESNEEEKPVIQSKKGIYFFLTSYKNESYHPSVINNTDYAYLISIFTKNDKGYSLLFGEKLQAKSSQSLTEIKAGDLDKIKTLYVQYFVFEDAEQLPELQNRSVKLKAKYFNNKDLAPLLNKEGYLIQLDQYDTGTTNDKVLQNAYPDDEEKSEVLREVKQGNKIEVITDPVIDIHAEKLGLDLVKMNASEIFRKQLRAFEAFVDRALLSNLPEIKVIHGKGNGILKGEIERKSSQHPHIVSFKTADDGGSTVVRFK